MTLSPAGGCHVREHPSPTIARMTPYRGSAPSAPATLDGMRVVEIAM
jgi:hypothetical protein